MSLKEFLFQLQKPGSKPYKLTHCYGARDAWKWVRRNKWAALNGNKCSETLYGDIISTINQKLAEKLLEGHRIDFPYNMGTLELTATEPDVYLKDGKMTNTYRIDWKKTLNYWYEDSKAREERKHIKRIQKYIYHIHYSKAKASYRNQKYYDLRLNRSLIRALGAKIDNEKLNALIY